MQNVRQISADELRTTIRNLAIGFAAEHYRRENPAAVEIDAWAWAKRHWQQFRERAIDAFALLSAEQQSSQGAAEN
jgi:hypothetical protein